MVALGRGGRSLSLLELVIALMLIGILTVVAIDRLLQLRVAAERAALERTLVTLRTVAVLELAGRLMRGEPRESLEGANPMALWARHVEYPLPRYLGELRDLGGREISAGSWYFDGANRVLVYRTLNEGVFHSSGPDGREARFRVVLSFDDRNGNGRRERGEPVQGVRVEPLDRYDWNEKPLAENSNT